ncbi:MAG: UvrD-helicase domain-containing protein [Nitrospirae bacterium]|nr:UvrD-helicase domain-containing protein [Nitrospirota bacterium]
MEKYLDVTKSVIISSPAGSGKTEKLARRYISLLLSGSEIEKILCITFTEKAAAEMKERILNILEKENPDLFLKIKEKMPLMRISTVHAFCLKLLKRFSIELVLDPSSDIMDEFEASLLWSESIYECLMEEKDNPALFFDMMKDKGIKGWDKLYSILNNLYYKRPISDLLLKTGYHSEGEEESKILELYSKCLSLYSDKKAERHLLDFNDLEILTYEALIKNSEWQNILYAFDEHTDHILVDEFQDTSSMQWKIIDKLTEEWRSGLGAKREAGEVPTIFLVGDDKQSIYLFRGANAGVFQEAKERLSEWMGNEFCFEEAKENFRSLPAIINFTNNLFEKLMPPSLHEGWKTRYAPFEATRHGTGRVELITVEAEANTKKSRAKEASALAKRISSLAGAYEISDGEGKRPCAYGDMAILLRKRTHLCLFENALRKKQIPFIVVKGIGFYDEPEVAALRELLSFIIDPSDDYSLFCVLRSPIFGIDYETLLGLINREEQPLIKKLRDDLTLSYIFKALTGWTERSRSMPLAILLEDILSETGGWKHYWEKQRHANIKKFIKLIESYEASGFSGLEIREKLIKARASDEPKANISTEGMNAVKIMTVHAAKGLQFPMVFLPSLDEAHSPRSSSIVIDEEESRISIAYEEDSLKRKKIPVFARRKEKESEEEKRLFYVAVTRARDFLCMLAALDEEKQPNGRLQYLTDSFEILTKGKIDKKAGLFEILTEPDIERLYSAARPSALSLKPLKPQPSVFIHTEPVSSEPAIKWRDVTEDTDIRIKHGEDWVLLGIIFHKLFEELSKGIMTKDRIQERALFLLKNEAFSEEDVQRLSSIILKDFQKLETSGYLNRIILPRENSFTEMPFILQKGSTVFRGRVDRIIIEADTAVIYDYKTYPVKDSELPELTEKYKFQMEIYKEAVSNILSLKTKSYLLFTHRPMILEI